MAFLFAFLMAVVPAQDAEIDALIRSLGADEPQERERAERRLVELGLRARPAVTKAAKEGNPETVARAKQILACPEFRMEELYEAGFRRETAAAIPGFGKRLWSSEPGERAAALRALADHGARENFVALAAVLGREELLDDARNACVDLLEKFKAPELAPLVIPLLLNRQSYIRNRVVQALVAAKAKDAAPEIALLLEDKESALVAFNALETLGVAPDAELVRRMLQSSEGMVRNVGLNAALKFRYDGFANDLIGFLLKHSADNPWPIQQALAKTRLSWTVLKPLLDAPTGPARLTGLRLAVGARMPEAIDAALQLLEDGTEETAAEAMEVLVAWGGPETIRKLSPMTGPASLIALARLGAPDAKARALKALESSNADLRRAAISALRFLDAHDLADVILARLEDPAPAVRAEAARVLPHLAGDAVGARLAARLAKEEDPKALARLLDAVAETGHAAVAPEVLRLLREGKGDGVPAAVRAAGALRLQGAAPILVQGYVTGKPEGMSGAYEALLQIRPKNLVDLLRPYMVPPKKEKPEEEAQNAPIIKLIETNHGDRSLERALYLLYVDPPGGKELFLESIKNGALRTCEVETLRFLCAEEAFPWMVERFERGSGRSSGVGRVLAAYGRQEYLDKAIAWLALDDRSAAFELLGGLNAESKIPDLVARLADPDPKIRDVALTALSVIDGPKTLEIFRRKLLDGPPMSRALAARYSAGWGDRGAIPLIEPLLDDADPAVRVEAVYALYLLDSTGSYDRVVAAYRRGIGKDDWVWPYALARLGGARGRDLIRPMIDAADTPERRKAALNAVALGGGQTEPEIAFVRSLLDDPDLGRDAWGVFLRVAPDRATALLSDPRYRLAMPRGNWSSVELEYVKDPGAEKALIALLEDRDPNNRYHAATLLGRRGVSEAAEPLARALHSDSPWLPRSAGVALARLGDARGVEPILNLPRSTTVGQGRMSEALMALNYVRNPEATRKLAGLQWERKGPAHWTLQEALEELARRSGMKLTISAAVPAHGLRSPPDWPRDTCGLEEFANRGPWSRFAAFVVEPDEIRVLSPDEAFRFWENWARNR
jgi:HEAT repeat protein